MPDEEGQAGAGEAGQQGAGEAGQQGAEQGAGQQAGSQGETTFDISKAIGKDGELLEGWQNHLVDENLRGQTVYDKVKTIQDATRQLAILDKHVGKTGVPIPGEDAIEAEIQAYGKAIGVPDSADGYEPLMQKPDGFPDEYWDDNLNKEARELFKRINITPKQASALFEFDMMRTTRGAEALSAAEVRAETETTEKWKGELGNAYDSTMHIVNRMVTENVAPEDMEKFLDENGNNTLFRKFAATVGKKFMEHGIITDIDPNTMLTGTQAATKMNELIATKGYADNSLRDTDPGKYARLKSEIEVLAKQLAMSDSSVS